MDWTTIPRPYWWCKRHRDTMDKCDCKIAPPPRLVVNIDPRFRPHAPQPVIAPKDGE